jgi:hypothetical protein
VSVKKEIEDGKHRVERERQRDRQRETDRERQTERQRERQRVERQRERQRVERPRTMNPRILLVDRLTSQEMNLPPETTAWSSQSPKPIAD